MILGQLRIGESPPSCAVLPNISFIFVDTTFLEITRIYFWDIAKEVESSLAKYFSPVLSSVAMLDTL